MSHGFRGLLNGVGTCLIPFVALAQEAEMTTIVNFSEPGTTSWTIVNDGVMGGRSDSDLTLTGEGTARFSGHVSLENNGGFASTRGLLPPTDLSPYDGVTLRVRGDGRRYQIRFRANDSFDGMAYKAEFDTRAGEWLEPYIPFRDFQPTVRGYRPPGVGPLDTGRIRQVGFLIGDKREGPFALEIAWVKARREER
jgi:hypothetical protein